MANHDGAGTSKGRTSGANEVALGLLRKEGASIRLSAGARILCQGDTAEKAFLLEEGLVVLKVADGDGRECCLGYRQSGSLLGSVSILSSGRYPASVTAQTEIRVIAISAESLLRLVEEEKTVSRYVHHAHAKDHYRWISRVSGEATLTARERVEEFLWEWMAEIGQSGRFRLPFSDSEFARFISVTPQHLCGVLQLLQKEKILTRSNGVFTIADRSRLFHRER